MGAKLHTTVFADASYRAIMRANQLYQFVIKEYVQP